ncbi:MAG: hypothetical protein MI866_09135 [Bacteroidales bacterium]|nr:hypothetical protein [Bacteroidales bacterium]
MKEARLHVDFNEMIEEDLVLLSKTDFKQDSNGNMVELKEGIHVKLYDHDLSSCNEVDNLITGGVVELNTHAGSAGEAKWCCRIDSKGIYNESQE